MRALSSFQCGQRSTPGVNAICGLSLFLVLSLSLRGFSPGNLVFSSVLKTNASKFQFSLYFIDAGHKDWQKRENGLKALVNEVIPRIKEDQSRVSSLLKLL